MDSTEKYNPVKNSALQRRYNRTIRFLTKTTKPPLAILDLGVANPLSTLLIEQGFNVINTKGEDLDDHPEIVKQYAADLVTAFEIFEHLINPLSVLRALPANRLITSVPLRLWFAGAYRHPSDKWDRHFHEFEDWQFDWLLEKSGWQIIRREKWTSPIRQLGLRPLLRLFYNRYYIVEAVRKNDHI